MAPKALLVVGVLMAALLFISSEVTAREMAETAEEEQTSAGVDQRCFFCRRCCLWWRPGCCRRCCFQQNEAANAVVEGADEAPEVKTEAKPHN